MQSVCSLNRWRDRRLKEEHHILSSYKLIFSPVTPPHKRMSVGSWELGENPKLATGVGLPESVQLWESENGKEGDAPSWVPRTGC